MKMFLKVVWLIFLFNTNLPQSHLAVRISRLRSTATITSKLPQTENKPPETLMAHPTLLSLSPRDNMYYVLTCGRDQEAVNGDHDAVSRLSEDQVILKIVSKAFTV